jgi:hypothetical protein
MMTSSGTRYANDMRSMTPSSATAARLPVDDLLDLLRPLRNLFGNERALQRSPVVAVKRPVVVSEHQTVEVEDLAIVGQV